MAADPSRLRVPSRLAAPLMLALSVLATPAAPKGVPQQRLVTRMEAYGNCPMPAAELGKMSHFVESGVVPSGRTYVGYGVMNVSRDVRRITQNVVYIYQCMDRGDPNCELWQRWRFGEAVCCINMGLRNMVWSSLMRSEPPGVCPMSKGLYRQDNVTVDAEKLKLLGFTEAMQAKYYKVRMEIDGDRTRLMNVCFEMSSIRVRAR